MNATIKEAELNKHNLTILPSGYGHWKISCDYRGKRISCITNDSEAVDNFKSERGDKRNGYNRILSGYCTLINEIIRNYKNSL